MSIALRDLDHPTHVNKQHRFPYVHSILLRRIRSFKYVDKFVRSRDCTQVKKRTLAVDSTNRDSDLVLHRPISRSIPLHLLANLCLHDIHHGYAHSCWLRDTTTERLATLDVNPRSCIAFWILSKSENNLEHVTEDSLDAHCRATMTKPSDARSVVRRIRK